MIVRPLAAADMEALERLVAGAGVGMTSLQADENSFKKRMENSLRSFAAEVRTPGKEQYLFVLEDDENGAIAGMCAIKAAVGLSDPFYSYRVATVVHASKKLGVHKTIPALYLSNDYTGCTEIGSLYLARDYRGNNNGKLLSKCRFPFMAEFPERFAEKVIAEMRGISDAQGHSPFWESLGKNFFDMDFPRADHLSGTGNKAFIAELMPKHPVYVSFLSEAAQAAIGEVHENTRPALKMLEREGFRYENYVDIFDAGPTLECRLNEIRAIRESRRPRVILGTPEGAEPVLICNTQLQGFRCCVAPLRLTEMATVVLDEATAARLMVAEGDTVRVVAL